jgi:hypothetical protein
MASEMNRLDRDCVPHNISLGTDTQPQDEAARRMLRAGQLRR